MVSSGDDGDEELELKRLAVGRLVVNFGSEPAVVHLLPADFVGSSF